LEFSVLIISTHSFGIAFFHDGGFCYPIGEFWGEIKQLLKKSGIENDIT
jgi:hypothetical protein